MFIDTHAHLDFEDFDKDRDETIQRAEAAGVSYIIDPGCDLPTSEKALMIAEKNPMVFAAVGIHPNNTGISSKEEFESIAKLANNPRVVAIGETGLDFYRDRSPKKIQVSFFQNQIELARRLTLPVIIHFRNVEQEGLELAGIERLIGVRGVFHCFGGSPEFAEEVVSMGFYIGFDGPLTYPKSDRVEVAEAVPLDRILIETDSPFLSPQNHRGQRNEPAWLPEIARKLAEIKKVDIGEVMYVTSRNAATLFKLPGK